MSYKKLVTFALMICSCNAIAANGSGTFDNPITQRVMEIPNPYNPQVKSKLSCFYYDNFMIKEIDYGEKGAEQLSINQFPSKSKLPVCDLKNNNEIIIKDWEGYFAGVKGEYIFFGHSDGVDGGFPFAVFNKNGGKLFSDSVGKGNFHSSRLISDGIAIRYQRAYNTSCSLYRERKKCWNEIKKETGLADDIPAPNCKKRYPGENIEANYLNMIGYEVEAVYSNGNLKINALPGKVRCWFPD